jgi:uncharacterized OB-fold protein
LTTLPAVRDGLFGESASVGEPLRLWASHCGGCGRMEFPAAPACPACGQPSPVEDLASEAILVGYTSVLHAPPGSKIPVPYSVGVACFGDELCVMGLLEEAAHEPRVGAAVTTVACSVAGEAVTYAFRLS